MNVHLDHRSVRFPSSGHIWVPQHGRRAAAAGLSMHSPCRPLKVLAQRVLYLGVRAFGSRVLPGERDSWEDPLPQDQWQQVLAELRSHTGSFDSLVLYRRPQRGRTGFAALLLREGAGVGFARFHPDAGRIEREFRIVSGIHAARPQSFDVARPIASGRVDEGGAWLLSESLPNYPLGAVRDAGQRDRVADELADLLAAVVDRDDATPAHWRAAHGDLSPWNLRTLLSGAVRVIDWEDAGFAPPRADRIYGALTAATTFGAPPPSSAPGETIDWLQQLIVARGRGTADAADRAMLDALAVMTRE
ncbi:hypothetical protein [Micropruina sonneratiae]|uniref:hypothetical protein n=1 Tax=Micropruina sonneratiae TaxID=2986940 RepID=UPI00222681D5|nr:hypothetical protein [Micropruina sp. KQZ13P-5]MCW3158758.1 hypothetical protein [Micropruina sp. KQZ13P-5]